MREKKLLVVLSSSLLALALAAIPFLGACAPGAAPTPAPGVEEMEPIVLVHSSTFPPPDISLFSSYTLRWEEMVTEATNGKVTFENYWGCALGKPPEHITMMKQGTVDVATASCLYTPGKLPLQNVDYTFPFGPTDPHIVTQANRQLYEEFPDMPNNMAQHNITRLYVTPTTNFVFLSRESMKTLDDFEGKKCACIGRWFGKWISSTGAVTVAHLGHERYTLLQTGVIEASFNPIDLAYNFGDIEVGPHCLDPDVIVCAPNQLWMCSDLLNSLPEDIQEVLIEKGKELEIIAAKEMQPEWTERVMREWNSLDEFYYSELSEADKAEWAGRCDDIPAEWAAEMEDVGFPGWEIVKRYQEITADLGFEWLREWGVQK